MEQAYPHRVVRWEWKASGGGTGRGFGPGEGCDLGELLGTERLPYWRLNKNADEGQRRALGIPPDGGESRPATKR